VHGIAETYVLDVMLHAADALEGRATEQGQRALAKGSPAPQLGAIPDSSRSASRFRREV
jgi:hypothetical protein